MTGPVSRRPPGPPRAQGKRRARAEPLPETAPKPAADDPEALRRIRAIRANRSYVRADLDTDLLARDELRPVRLQLEYLKTELLLEEHGIGSTIVVFGGTRIAEPAAARRQLERARQRLAERPGDAERRRRVAVAERIVAKSRYYDMAREFGRLVSIACQVSASCEFVVVTGGGPGIMEAANRGAFDVHAKTIGLNINLAMEQYPNPYITPDLCFQFRYFALRKMHFLQRAKALVAFPGGYGTLDELFDALCLVQTGKIPALPIVLVGEDFWRRAFDADFLAAEGVVDPEDVSLFRYAESAEEAWERIVQFWNEAGEDLLGAEPPLKE
jgi:uncharacterized protein (TIGR00730 family)